MDIATIRAVLPAVADTTKYPDAMLTYWLGIGTARLDPSIWQGNLDEGLLYFTAHQSLMSAMGAAKGGNGNGGIVASKSLGPGSIGYNTTLGTIEGAGIFNLTVPGRQFWQLAQMVGAGGLQLNPIGYLGDGSIGIPLGGGIII